MPVYHGGERIEAIYANSGEEQCPAYVNGEQVNECGPDVVPDFRYFKISITANNGHANHVAVQEVELATSPGGLDITNPGMPTTALFLHAAITPNYFINNEFGDYLLSWLSLFDYQSPNYMTVDTAGSHTLEELRIWTFNIVDGEPIQPREFVLQGSNDKATWHLIKSFSDVTGWVVGSSKTFDLTSAGSTTRKIYQNRLNVLVQAVAPL